MPPSILSFFPEGLTPSPEQRDLLLAYEALEENVQVVCVVMPVAAGKMYMLSTICQWEAHKNGKGAVLAVPTNALVRQGIESVGGMGFKAPPPPGSYSQKMAWLNEPLKLCNSYSYLAHKAYAPCVSFDEAHKLVDMLREKEAVKIWRHLTPWPWGLHTIEQFLYWVHGLTGENAREKKLLSILKKDVGDFIIEQGKALYRGEEQELLKLVPLTPRNNKPMLWPPSKVKRLILASATLSQEDLYDLGLDRRRVAWLMCESRIPPENRPLVYEPYASPTYGRQDEVRKLAEGIKLIAGRHSDSRGLIHISYGMASLLRPYLNDKRFMFHSKDSKASAFSQWQASPNGVLLAAGMHEGIDLKYDMCRWQIIAKIMWPSLADGAIRAKQAERPEWFVWEAVKIFLQSYGRVSRMPDDFGITYIITSEFERLLKEGRHLMPKWALDSLS